MVPRADEHGSPPVAVAGRRRGADRAPLGWTGLVLGLVALSLAVLPSWVAPLWDPPPPPLGRQAGEVLRELRDRAAAVLGTPPRAPEPPPPPNPWRDPRLALATLCAAFAAIVLATLAFARREDPRVVATALTVGAGTVASEHVLTAALILVFAVTAVVMAAIAGRRGV